MTDFSPGDERWPPFDETWRPATAPNGEQLAPETFRRWVAPAAWEDLDGRVHLDVHVFHRWLGWPITPALIQETTQMLTTSIAAGLPAMGLDASTWIIRP